MITVFVTSALGNSFLYLKILKALNSREIVQSSSSVPSAASKNINRARDQVARTLIINGIVFFICQIPSRIDNLDDSFDRIIKDFAILTEEQEATLTLVGHAFLFLNSVINPFIYVGTCRHYRQSMIEAFTFRRRHEVVARRCDTRPTSTTNTSL